MLAACRSTLRGSSQFRVYQAGQVATLRFSSTTTPNTRDSASGQDTHDDFKPQVRPEPTGSVMDVIKSDLKNNDVFLYMKGNPEAPMCGFSNMACRILDAYRVKYGSRDVLVDPELREEIKKYSQWPTIPQVYVKGEFIGGSDLLMDMHQKGELDGVLKGES